MARIFTDGCETGDVSFFDVVSGTVQASTTTPGSGAYSYYQGSSAANATKNFTAISECYLRVRWKGVTTGGYFQLRNSANSQIQVTIDLVNTRLNVTGATTGNTPNGSFLANTWYLVELHYKESDTVGEVEIKIDGVSQFSFSGDTKPSTQTNFDNLYFYSQQYYYDDIAMNDVNGGVDDSWCDDGRVYILTPNGAGDSTQWTPSTGSNYQCVDEIPPVDTDYVEATTSGYIDNYNMTTYTLASGEAVRRVWPTIRVKDTASAGTIKLGLKTVSTNYVSTYNVGTSFARINGAEQKVNPNTGTAWTQAQLDALQITLEMP